MTRQPHTITIRKLNRSGTRIHANGAWWTLGEDMRGALEPDQTYSVLIEGMRVVAFQAEDSAHDTDVYMTAHWPHDPDTEQEAGRAEEIAIAAQVQRAEDPLQHAPPNKRGMAKILLNRAEKGLDGAFFKNGKSVMQRLADIFDGTPIGRDFQSALPSEIQDIGRKWGLI